MENPNDRKYSKDHEWIKVDGEIGAIGITDHAQHLLTDVVFVELPQIGKQVEQHKQLAVVESVKSVSDVYAPVSGEVTEINTELESAPEKINQDAFNAWIAKIKIKDKNELNGLMDSADYTQFIKEEKH